MRTLRLLPLLIAAGAVLAAAPSSGQAPGPETPPVWASAHRKKPMDAAETRAFIRRLAMYVYDHHLKPAPGSEQRGMTYEYFDTARQGQPGQWVQGEALDTMHDGAWLAAAMVNAYRATGDAFYRRFLTEWQLPFYDRMLNHSDTLFSPEENDARPERQKIWDEVRETLLRAREKGFVPYWWDDGASVSLERPRNRNPRPDYPAYDCYVARRQPNPEYRLCGYSIGSSNHMAQDLGVMVQQAWLLLRDGKGEDDRKLVAETAEAARNLHAGRMSHFGHIPMCCSATALANEDANEMRRVPDPASAAYWTPSNHYTQALYAFKPGQRVAFPGFSDDQEYNYYFGIARAGGKLPKPLAFKTIYDAFTEPQLYRLYSDDAEVPAGVGTFDLHPYYARDGRIVDYRSDRKGPSGRPRPTGSRFGPQNMVCCGWALQALRRYPGIWEERYRSRFPNDWRVYMVPEGTRQVAFPTQGLELGPVQANLVSTPRALIVFGRCRGDSAVVKLYSRPDQQGTYAAVTLKADGTVTAVNDRGAALRITGQTTRQDTGFQFRFTLPYTVAKGQKGWANGIEHARYSIQIGQERRNLYVMSSEREVKAWLEHELGGGLRTWEAIFNEKGFIPTGLGTGSDWDRYSDNGGYAHLISAASEWLLCLEGKRDWEEHHIPAVLTDTSATDRDRTPLRPNRAR